MLCIIIPPNLLGQKIDTITKNRGHGPPLSYPSMQGRKGGLVSAHGWTRAIVRPPVPMPGVLVAHLTVWAYFNKTPPFRVDGERLFTRRRCADKDICGDGWSA